MCAVVSPASTGSSCPAAVGGVPAARREPAARRRVDQVRRRAGDGVQPLPGLRGLLRQRVEQRLGVRVPRVVVERPGLGGLHDPARVHDRHPVRAAGDDAQVVGDQDDRHAQPLPQVVDELQDLLLDGHVERGGRLVGDQQLGLAGQRHRDHHALPHAAGELVRVLVDPLPRPGHARPGRAPRRPGRRPPSWSRPGAAAPPRRSACPRCASGFSEDSGSWKIMPISLPRILRIASAPRSLISRPPSLMEPPTMCPPFGQQVHDRQRGHRLAAAGLAHDAERLALVDVQRHAVHRVHHAVLELDARCAGPRSAVAPSRSPSYRRCSRVSNASRSASPMKLNAMQVRMIATPGG